MMVMIVPLSRFCEDSNNALHVSSVQVLAMLFLLLFLDELSKLASAGERGACLIL